MKKKDDKSNKPQGLHISLISVHGLIRSHDQELGRDADTGGQIKYVFELAQALSERSEVRRIDLITRQIIDERVDDDYAQLEETISDKAKLIRIPFGPRRYLHKERLWPYLDLFVDHAISFFRKTGGAPDIIHGHYADAGYAGAQLSRLLGVPFVFTGHSLGRVKRQRLSTKDTDAAKLEERYRFSTRIEAEEFALETASLVIASTGQEVEDQYQLYDHYVPERMEIVPPGVDLTLFAPPAPDYTPPTQISDAVNRFLSDPSKPLILAMARPDERKNLEMLVHVYGQSEELQTKANLLLILGNRDDIREMAGGQRKVMRNILTLIDTYNLYGKVAYPKNHRADDVPELYRIATRSGGVFVNPALTEPFGLTLLESAASGLPVIATNDGGPRDILGNCHNGLLVDPLDQQAIENALNRALSDRQQWQEWADNGVAGATRHYSWKNHAQTYLRNLGKIMAGHQPAAVNLGRKPRNIPDFDRIVICDIDNTLIGDDDGLREFVELLDSARHVGFGIATGRSYKVTMDLFNELDIPRPDLMITSVGTEIFYGNSHTPDRTWRKQIDFCWEPEHIRAVLDQIKGVNIQDPVDQSRYKISYQVDPSVAPRLSGIRRILRENGVRAKVIFSFGIFLDIIPFRAGSGLAIRHLSYKWGLPLEHLLVAGDSGNDDEMLRGQTLGVVVGNYSPELKRLRNRPRIYFADACHARGIIEGMHYYNFLDQVTIPNDRIE